VGTVAGATSSSSSEEDAEEEEEEADAVTAADVARFVIALDQLAFAGDEDEAGETAAARAHRRQTPPSPAHVSCIGQGAFGSVHRAVWHGTPVAVKVLLCKDLDPQVLSEFAQEVLVMARMRHPNVVLFMGACTHSPHRYIVTEMAERGSLWDVLRMPEHGYESLPWGMRCGMALDAARGLCYLHESGLGPRDLKVRWMAACFVDGVHCSVLAADAC
jgi:hypothetical protein